MGLLASSSLLLLGEDGLVRNSDDHLYEILEVSGLLYSGRRRDDQRLRGCGERESFESRGSSKTA